MLQLKIDDYTLPLLNKFCAKGMDSSQFSKLATDLKILVFSESLIFFGKRSNIFRPKKDIFSVS